MSPLSYTLALEKNNFINLTHQMNNYNEIYNMNKYVSNVNMNELERLAFVSENLKSKVLKLKQEYMLYDVSMKKIGFWVNILYFTLVLICLTFFAIAFYNKGVAENNIVITDTILYIIIGVLGVVYLIVLIVLLATNIRRRKYFYDQYYWKPATA